MTTPTGLIRIVTRLSDLVVASVVTAWTVLWAATRRSSDRSGSVELVVLDTSYSWKQIEERELHFAITARECEGLFDSVTSVHPLVGADEEIDVDSAVSEHHLGDQHRFVEASVSGGRPERGATLSSIAQSQRILLGILREAAAGGGVRIVRVGDPYYLGLLGWWLARLANCPLVVRVNANHDLLYEIGGHLAYPRLIRSRRLETMLAGFVLSRANLVLAPSEDNCAFAVNNGARNDLVHLSPYGSLLHPVHFGDPADRPSIRPELGIGGRPLIASVTRLEPAKRVEDLVKVLKVVVDEIPDAVCVIAGDGSLRSSLQGAARAAGIDDNLLLVGNRPQRWLASLLADADVVLFPLAGRALVEATLSGSPLVVYDLEWHHEALEDQVSGFLVEPGDTIRMARVAIDLIRYPEKAVPIAAAARQAAIRRFDRSELIARERHLMKGLLKSGSMSPRVGNGDMGSGEQQETSHL